MTTTSTPPTTTTTGTKAPVAEPPPLPWQLSGAVAYPRRVAEAYRAAGYWTDALLGDLLADGARRAPERVAVADATQAWTYRGLARRVDRLAAGLLERGVQRGRRVVVRIGNDVEFARVAFALWRIGAIPVLARTDHGHDDVHYLCRYTGAVGYISSGGPGEVELARRVRDEVPSVRLVAVVGAGEGDVPGVLDLQSSDPLPPCPGVASDVALLQVSGGVRGTTKLIPRTHADYLYAIRESARVCGFDERSVLLLTVPAAHNFGLSSPGLLGAMWAGATTVLAADASPASVFGPVAAHGVTHASAFPPAVLEWLDSPLRGEADLSSLETLLVGGARLPEPVARRVRPELGCRLQQVYGMPEGFVAYTRRGDDEGVAASTQGLPVGHATEVRIVDDAGAPVAPGEPGHLLVRGPDTIRGYYRSPEHDAHAFTEDGFFRTGDVVRRVDGGHLVVCGRAQERLVRDGVAVFPQDLEAHLLAVGEVYDAAVVGVTDTPGAERIVAHVVLRAGAEIGPAELVAHLRSRGVPDAHLPDDVVLAEALPRTGLGKIDRRRLRRGSDEDWYDIVGVGFGPANLALTIAVDEHNAACAPADRLRLLNCEKRGGSQWHPGMLLPDAHMQVSFLKDLATFRNPTSPYTFVAFLHHVGRLVDFTNRDETAPLRIEFAAYLRWVAEQLEGYASLSTEVLAVSPIRPASGGLEGFEVTIRAHGEVRTLRARNVSVAGGLIPRYPAGIGPGRRVWHSHTYLDHAPSLAGAREVVVLGSGQSAVEVALDMYERLEGVRVHLVSSQFGIGPSEHGPLVNHIFDPDAVDAIFDAPEEVRQRLDRLHRGANHGTANPRQLEQFEHVRYRDQWLGVDRLQLHRVSRIEDVQAGRDHVGVTIRSDLDGSTLRVQADALVCATGYRAFDTGTLLGEHADLLVRDAEGRPLVDRDCRARLTEAGPGGLYLVGQSEHQHGFSTSLLSTIAVRSGRILDSMLAHRADAQAAAGPAEAGSAGAGSVGEEAAAEQ